jgi:hypothetical protein
MLTYCLGLSIDSNYSHIAWLRTICAPKEDCRQITACGKTRSLESFVRSTPS